MNNSITRSAAILLTALALPLSATAQSFPSKPIRIVVPYPPGGVDGFTRVMMPRMTEVLGQPIVLENRGGANGAIGAELVAREVPDGHTLLFVASSTVIGAVKMMKDIRFDPIKDFTPISQLALVQFGITAGPASGAHRHGAQDADQRGE